MEKDFNVKIKVRNGRVIGRMKLLDIGSITRLAELCGSNTNEVCALITFRKAPLLKNGDWTKTALNISSALKCEPEELWPEHIARLRAKKAETEINIDAKDIASISAAPVPQITGLSQAIEKTLSKLKAKEVEIIRRRFGFNGPEETYEEIAADFKTSRERIRQIEAFALRKLKHQTYRSRLMVYKHDD